MAVGDQITKNSEWVYNSSNRQWYAKITAKITEETTTTATIEVGGWLYISGMVTSGAPDIAYVNGQLFLDVIGGVANQVQDEGVKDIAFATSNSGWLYADSPCITGKWTITKNSSDEISVSPKFEIIGLGYYNDVHFILTPDEVLSLNPLPTYTISYDTNEGRWRNEAPADQTKTHDMSLTLTSIQPIRTGYNFKGWNTHPDGTGISYEVSDDYTENANATLYAQWEIRTYPISYNANEGAWENDEAPADQIKIYDQPLALTSIHPIRTGYNFMGWKTIDGNGRTTYYQIVDNYTKNASVTFYAVWTIIKYHIWYEPNGGYFESYNNNPYNPKHETKSYGQSYKIIDTIPTRGEKYDFNGWNTEPDGTGETYLSNSTYENNKNLILYAQWQPESYVVSYNFNGGNSEVISNQSKDYDIPLVLTSKIPSKTGYTFINWNTLQNGTGNVYLPNDIYNENEGITLYAQWREKSKGWINKIKLLTGFEDNRIENEFTLGATFDQVQYSENNAMTLLDFINIIKKFFKSKMFMHYCGQEPTDNVMEWYQVVATNANPTKDELNAILG